MSSPKYDQVKEFIQTHIRDGLWQDGDKIPSQLELEQACHVSRITVKRAIADLIAEGILEHLPGRKGTFVKVSESRAVTPARLIAVAIDDVRDTFGAEILRGIEDYLWEKKYHPLVCNSDRDFGKVEQYFHSLFQQPVAGVIFAPVIDEEYIRNNTKILKLFEQRQLPFVLIDRYIPGYLTNYVITSHRESSKKLVQHLLRSGHRRILVVRGLECSSMQARVQGYRDAYQENGLPVDEHLIIRVNDNRLYPESDVHEVERMKTLIGQAGDFTAFYALNGRILRAGIDVLLDSGLLPGEQVQITLHDNISKPYPPYTDSIWHISQPSYHIGWEAAKILLDDIQQPQQKTVRVVLNSSLTCK